MLKEVAAEGVFDSKPGSRERGTSWQKVANKQNSLPQFSVNSRSIRDRFNNISRKLKAKLSRESNESGGGGGGTWKSQPNWKCCWRSCYS